MRKQNKCWIPLYAKADWNDMKKTEYKWIVHGDAANQGHYHRKELCTLFNFKLTAGSHETLHSTQDCQSKDQQTLDHSRPVQTHRKKTQDMQEDESWRSQDDRNWKMRSKSSDYETQCKLRWTYWNYLNDTFSEQDSTQADMEMKNKHLIYII